jgi:hypothetical protein
MSKSKTPTKPLPSLKAFAENGVGGISKATSFRVPPDKIEFEEGFNLREDNEETRAHIERLYKAMKQGAFMPPIDVQVIEGRIIAREGHCRTKAALKLVKEMPEFTLECRQLRGNDADAVIHMLGTGSGGKPLTPLEAGRGYLRLVTMGMKSTEIAARLGVSRVTIDNGLTLAEASPELQKMISAGDVSSTTVRDAIKAGPEAVEALKKAVKEERAKPAPAATKPGKKSPPAPAKKKVTAKKLRGTAADKSSRPKKSKKQAQVEAEQADILNGPSIAGNEPAKSADESVIITVKKTTAKAAADFLRGFGGEDAELKSLASALEMALM